MKKINSKMLMSACLAAGSILLSADANSQERKLPDGTIVYSDGTRRLPNGTVIYKGGNNGNNNDNRNNSGVVTLPDGTVVYPDGSRRYPNQERRTHRRTRGNDGEWLPPGQARKTYGGRGKDYNHGQQKKWKGNGHGKGNRNGHGDRDDD
ncbi:MAG: hypothetical protein JWR18_208 [Segetibacter sp.]|jgi:hypothetical protein|nr:hypothetical protein [Segetibacter sp.]